MAKNENKYIGYLALSVIPLIGIVWAAVAGQLHNKYVANCIKTENEFEKHFATLLNNLNLTSSSEGIGQYVATDSPNGLSDLNITSIRPLSYDVRVDWDPIEDQDYPTKSFSIEVKANPKTNNENDEVKFQLTYEFFVTFDVYENFSEYYNKDLIQEIGTQDYTYLTYYKNNPRNCPIVALSNCFDTYYKNICFYEYNDDVIVGNSGSIVFNLIDEIDENSITIDSATLLTRILNLYQLLTPAEKANVTNYDSLVRYNQILEAKKVENMILALQTKIDGGEIPSDFDVQEARTKYNKISSDIQSFVSNYSYLVEVEANLPIMKFTKYYNQIATIDKQNNLSSYYSKIKTVVNTYYNKLTSEQKTKIDSSIVSQLALYVQEYNADPNNKTKLSMN